MYKVTRVVSAIALAALVSAPSFAIELKTDEDKASYAAGFSSASSMLRDANATGLKADMMLKGFTAAIKGEENSLNPVEMRQALMKAQYFRRQADKQKSDVTRQSNIEWLAKNLERDEVKALPSGVQYEVFSSGAKEGAKPTRADDVLVHYQGSLIDGTVFDSTIRRGKPTTLNVGGVVPGFSDALLNMTLGDKWRVYIPSKLAYGEKRTGPIPAESILIFDLELLKIN
ncbi:MAG: peptidylprolyl isomerase [Alteromonadaceae bacterium]|nr:MAG: peptidylprolyl isomerase [Alteromonadaceae bacterium]